MFISKDELKEIKDAIKEFSERIESLEIISKHIVRYLDEKDKQRGEDQKLLDALVNNGLDNSKTIGALLKSDEDRIKALNFTMDKVEEVSENIGLLAKILNEKGIITIEDLKGDSND